MPSLSLSQNSNINPAPRPYTLTPFALFLLLDSLSRARPVLATVDPSTLGPAGNTKHHAAMGKRMRVPNCTHLDMDRVFGHDQHCSICGRSPSIGFLYECRQDHKITTLRTILSKEHGRIEPVKSALRQELERIGLSESIIRNAESGHYTATQLKKLKELKLELKQVISDTRQATEASDVVARLTALAGATYSIDGTFSSLPVTDSVSILPIVKAAGPH